MKYIFGNWKMNMTKSDIKQFTKTFKISKLQSTVVGLAVPSIYVPLCEGLSKRVMIGLQNVSEYTQGAYTGEISSTMARDMGVTFSLVGHSERRMYFKETNAQLLDKIYRLLEVGIVPILCVGENLQEREGGKTRQVISRQLSILKNIPSNAQIIVAYEPVWAIGTGVSAKLYDIGEVANFIKDEIRENIAVDYDTIVLYGGSVTPENCESILNLTSVDGVLVGGASLDGAKFSKIVNFCK